MAQKKNKPQESQVVAELTVTSDQGSEIIRSFDSAWHRALELPTPVSIRFNSFVRKD